MTLDHSIPKTRGGKGTTWNLNPSCQPCNVEKGNMTKDEYREYLTLRAYFAKEEISLTMDQIRWVENKFAISMKIPMHIFHGDAV